MGMTKRLPLLRLPAALAVVFLLACGDSGPQSGPGVLTVTVVSPSGAEGSAVVSIFGPGIGDLTALGGRLFESRRADTVRVVLVNDDAGDLAFSVAVADTTQPPVGVVLQVADAEDRLRDVLAGYALEVRR
jgi:hypothetical protein